MMEQFRAAVDIKDRKYHLKKYRACFVGYEAVNVIMRLFGMWLALGAAGHAEMLAKKCEWRAHCMHFVNLEKYIIIRVNLRRPPFASPSLHAAPAYCFTVFDNSYDDGTLQAGQSMRQVLTLC